jgi:hypothetical protein
MAVMAKKDSQRIAFQYTKEWADLARQLAKKDQKPTIWFLIKLLAEAADKEDLDRPRLPWEEES